MARSTPARARAAIDAAGGLVTAAELAAEWGITRQAIADRIARGSFPEPVKIVNGARLYLRADVERLRRYREGERVPRTGQWALANNQDQPGGVLHQLREGEPFPAARPGYSWLFAHSARGEIPPIRSLAERQQRSRRR
jgi:predicted DNA-binding transcriptional regulator AlpA